MGDVGGQGSLLKVNNPLRYLGGGLRAADSGRAGVSASRLWAAGEALRAGNASSINQLVRRITSCAFEGGVSSGHRGEPPLDSLTEQTMVANLGRIAIGVVWLLGRDAEDVASDAVVVALVEGCREAPASPGSLTRAKVGWSSGGRDTVAASPPDVEAAFRQTCLQFCHALRRVFSSPHGNQL